MNVTRRWADTGNSTMADEHRYDDIIGLEHPTSRKHPRMSAEDRAAQFAPFAALTGYDEMVEDAERASMENDDA